MVQHDMHHQHPRHLLDCHVAKHVCIVVVYFVNGTLKGFTSERHSGAILQIVKCIVDATSQPCYKWGSPVTQLHTALLYKTQTREPLRQMCLFMLSVVTVLRMLQNCISACQCTG